MLQNSLVISFSVINYVVKKRGPFRSPSFFLLNEFLQVLVQRGYREAHDRVEGTFDSGDADVAYPFLDAIGASFVEGLELVYVIEYFLVGQFIEINAGLVGEGIAAGIAADCNGCYDRMDIS